MKKVQLKKTVKLKCCRIIVFVGNCEIKMHKKSVFSQKTKIEMTII